MSYRPSIASFGSLLWLAVPGASVLLALIVLPVGYAVSLSFFKLETIISAPEFAGFANFQNVLRDGAFWNAFGNGLVYASASIVAQIVLGITFALILNERFVGRSLLRGAAIIPYAVPPVAGVFIWRWMLDENFGVLTAAVESLGIHIGWLSDPRWAMFTVVLISLWLWTPFVAVTVLAGLQTVNQALYEAAHIDGASAIQRFWHVTLPGIWPVLIVVALLRGIWMFNKFDVIWLTTSGGPLNSTENLSILAYEQAFSAFNVGRGASIAVLNGLFVLVGALLYMRLTRARA